MVFPERTFYLCAKTGVEADEWIKILRWKLVSLFRLDLFHSPGKNSNTSTQATGGTSTPPSPAFWKHLGVRSDWGKVDDYNTFWLSNSHTAVNPSVCEGRVLLSVVQTSWMWVICQIACVILTHFLITENTVFLQPPILCWLYSTMLQCYNCVANTLFDSTSLKVKVESLWPVNLTPDLSCAIFFTSYREVQWI